MYPTNTAIKGTCKVIFGNIQFLLFLLYDTVKSSAIIPAIKLLLNKNTLNDVAVCVFYYNNCNTFGKM